MVEESSRAIIFDWSPRPHHAQKIVLEALGKAENPEEKGIIFPEIAAKVQKWYAKDKTVSIQEELRDRIMAIHASEKSNRADIWLSARLDFKKKLAFVVNPVDCIRKIIGNEHCPIW